MTTDPLAPPPPPAPPADKKLGKAPARIDPRTFQLANYLKPTAKALPLPKSRTSLIQNVRKWPMFANDRVGDCTCAAAGHAIRMWTRNADGKGRTVTLPDADVLAAYSAVTGYDPARPETDEGAYLLDVLSYWRHVGIGGHKITAYAAIEPRNRDHVRISVRMFGGLYLGLGLPLTAVGQRVWSVVPGDARTNPYMLPWSWGGHCVEVVAYDEQGLTVVTWGALQRMTWAFFDRYCDEAFAVLSDDWADDSGKTPTGFDMAALREDLAAVRRA